MVLDILHKFGPVTSKDQTFPTVKELPFKYLGLYFTAVWCSSCVRSSPSLKKIIQKIQSDSPGDFKLLTIRMDEEQSDFGYNFWKMPKLNYFGAGEISRIFQVRFLPTILIFNQKGQIVSKNGFQQIFSHKENVLSHWDSMSA